MDRLDPYKFVRYSQMFGRIVMTWPPHPKTRISVVIFNNLLWNIGVSCNILCFILMFIQITRFEDDPITLSRSISLISIVGDTWLQLILVRLQWPQLQILIREILSFLKTAKVSEQKVCLKYIKRYLSHHLFLCGSFAGAIATFSFSPLTLKKRFPIDMWCPFSTDPIFNRLLVYFLQYLTILQSLALLSGDCMVITLLWFSSVRLELLGLDYQKVEDVFHLRSCVKNHQKILRFVKETECAIRLLVMKILFAISVTIVCAGVQLLHQRSLTDLSTFLLIVSIAGVRLFGFTCAGDDLTEMAANLSNSMFQSPAVTKSFHLGNSLSIVILRSQKALIITMWAKSIELSLEFFTTYVLSVTSFFMTLRAVLDRYVSD